MDSEVARDPNRNSVRYKKIKWKNYVEKNLWKKFLGKRDVQN